MTGEVVEMMRMGADYTHRAASSISGAQLRLDDCAELGAVITDMLANLVTVSERLAEGVASLGTETDLNHLGGEDPTAHLVDATKHLADLRARLSSAVASGGSYRHEIHLLSESEKEQ
jgi:hypothetical protein